jgi:hypothetical protein
LTKNWIGLHFGRFFAKLIWSPCFQVTPTQSKPVNPPLSSQPVAAEMKKVKRKDPITLDLFQALQVSRLPADLVVWIFGFFFKKKLPPYTLAGFDLATHSSGLFGGRRRRYH